MKHSNLRYIGVLLFFFVGFSISVIRNDASNQILEAEPHNFSETLFPQEDWLKYSRQQAIANGLTGEPQREEITIMTYGSYSMLVGRNPNPSLMSRDALVVVYQVLGDVPELNGFGMAAGRTDISGFIFVYNATTGSNFASTALVEGKPGTLDLSRIPVDDGTLPDLDLANKATVIPDLPSPESTADLVPLP